jgi:dolichol-phosphate mannosyltransferase
MGYGAALRSCFEAARRMGAERMVIIDSDGQHDASDIPKLLSPLNSGCDEGSRFCDGNGEDVTGRVMLLPGWSQSF